MPLFGQQTAHHRYLHQHEGRPAWALVTGASDGIGLGFVQELSERGFNVILHGRNEAKLKRVRDSLEEEFQDREFKMFIHDAENELTAEALHDLAESLQDIHLTVLINNVGGSGSVQPAWQPFIQRSSGDIDSYINLNARFPTQLTRALLPRLIDNAPSLIMNLSSFAALYPAPYVSVYAGAKAFNLAWSASLKAEMKAEKIDVDVLGIVIAKAQSATVRAETGFFTPSSRDMAKAALEEAGCKKRVVTPAWSHAFQQWILDLLPESLLEAVLIKAAQAEKRKAN